MLNHVSLTAVNRERSARFHEAGVTETEWQDEGPTRVQVSDPDGNRVEFFAY